MATEVFYRTELKYVLDDDACEMMMERLSERMEQDCYNGIDEFYTICNIYFDTWDNYYIRTSLQKPVYKEKVRLRGYGVPDLQDKVYMEIKKKVSGIVNKRRCGMTLKQAYGTIDCDENCVETGTNPQVLQELDYIFQTRRLDPKLYIAYDRKAFFDSYDRSLRITFDRNIRTRRDNLRMELGDYGYPLLRDGVWLMEIKAEQGIPLWLTMLLSANKLYPSSFSKYGAEYLRMINQNNAEKGTPSCLSPYLRSLLMPLSQPVAQYLAS